MLLGSPQDDNNPPNESIDMVPKSSRTPLLFLFKLFARLPIGALQGIARSLTGLILLMPSASISKTVRRNLLLTYPEKTEQEREQMTKDSLRSQAMSLMEFIKTWGSPPQYSVDQIREVHGKELFLEALKNPKGLIGIIPHQGTWEMMNAWVNQYTAPTIMYKPADNPSLDAFVLAARSRLNATLVPTDESGVRSIFRTLKQGGFAAILPDHTPDESGGILSPFFGHHVLTTTLVSRLAQKTGCGVIQMACIRRDDGDGFDIFFEELPEEIHSQDLQTSVNTLNVAVENLIRRNPIQYQWAYKRFKDAPNLKDIYRMSDAEVKQVLADKPKV
ncbi:MAG: lysophospholipid acyltransferase family protein [Aquirhabdus sp.]